MKKDNIQADVVFAASDPPLDVMQKMAMVLDWKLGTDRTIPGRLRKLGEELGEMHEALFYPTPETYPAMVYEIADVAIVLQDILVILARSWEKIPLPLSVVMALKMEANRLRWLEEDNGK